jgi:hypothetical protein
VTPRLLFAPFFFALLVGGCQKKASVAVDAAPPPSLKAAVPADSPRASDPLWKIAEDGDPIHLAQLADQEGADGLLEGVESGGDAARTALAAIPYADDAERAFLRLGQIAVQVDDDQAAAVLGALAGALGRPMHDVEPVDPPGARGCAEAMLEIANKGGVRRDVRAAAVSVLRRLAERRAMDPRAIPTDLDAK